MADVTFLPKSVKDRNGDKAEDLIPSGDEVLRGIFQKNQRQASFSRDDIANGKCPRYRSTRLVLTNRLQIAMANRVRVQAKCRYFLEPQYIVHL